MTKPQKVQIEPLPILGDGKKQNKAIIHISMVKLKALASKKI